MSRAGALSRWVDELPAAGRYVFSRADIAGISGASPASIRATLRRLKTRGAIATPRRGFYVVVPPEYRSAGCPPATWFVDDLMRHIGRRYYVALLTAAALHGAGHQQPMAFQVITDAAERSVRMGPVRIEFHASNRMDGAATVPMQTQTGTMIVSTPETTAFDLVRFAAVSGYWSQVATVLAELAERLDAARLVEGAARVARSDVQRLGWLLDFIECPALADPIADALRGHRLVPVRLNSQRDAGDAVRDHRWNVLVNDEVEPDL